MRGRRGEEELERRTRGGEEMPSGLCIRVSPAAGGGRELIQRWCAVDLSSDQQRGLLPRLWCLIRWICWDQPAAASLMADLESV